MPKAKLVSAAARNRALQVHAELLLRGREFLHLRQEHVNNPDCLVSTIMACIAEGARTRDQIIRNVPRFVGHSYSQVAAELDRYAGSSPVDHYWYRDEAKTYHLHFQPEALAPAIQLNLDPIRRRKREPRPVGPFDADVSEAF